MKTLYLCILIACQLAAETPLDFCIRNPTWVCLECPDKPGVCKRTGSRDPLLYSKCASLLIYFEGDMLPVAFGDYYMSKTRPWLPGGLRRQPYDIIFPFPGEEGLTFVPGFAQGKRVQIVCTR